MTAQHSTKGQIQINETLLVLFALVLLIIVGIFVYYRFSLANVEHITDELTEQEASVLLASVSHLPELRCSHVNCIDTSKLLPFQTLARGDRAYYSRLFGAKRIMIEQTYPAPDTEHPCTITAYNQLIYPANCQHWIIYDQPPTSPHDLKKISTPITLYYPETDSYGVGKLEIGIY